LSLRTISFGPTGLRGYNCLCWYVGHNLFANDIIIGFVLMDKTAIRNLYCFFFQYACSSSVHINQVSLFRSSVSVSLHLLFCRE
jgi:hypothetical protein